MPDPDLPRLPRYQEHARDPLGGATAGPERAASGEERTEVVVIQRPAAMPIGPLALALGAVAAALLAAIGRRRRGHRAEPADQGDDQAA